MLEELSVAIMKEKKEKEIQIGKDEFTLSLYEENIMLFMRSSNLHYPNARSYQQFQSCVSVQN